ncbi:hypothetical protein [Deinococcus maricopensis]|uniref:Transcriptional regulator n=1 Tax=Deinococcus maricopensis (strain DSM 21211 / LMG 22137 / NRRL B-23946 / LB-34) TaxID=709986 RepID=E8U5L9_DEIML|nr:hypothetical protein [Deinococcus maricopensis]ADV66358.1 hypothetical protein Deima_0702 [Deinococcus maricopensis DSM 21211]
MTEAELSSLPPGTQVITRADAAAFLTDPDRQLYLAPFLQREVTLSAAARELALPLGRVHYWAGRLVQLDLLRVTRAAPRAGRAVRHYTATAPAFFVPFALTAAETVAAQITHDQEVRQRHLSAAHARALGQLPPGHGQLIERMPETDEGLRIRSVPEGAPGTPLLSTWLERPYRHADALALRADLDALAKRYAALPEPDEGDARTYCLRLALAPM